VGATENRDDAFRQKSITRFVGSDSLAVLVAGQVKPAEQGASSLAESDSFGGILPAQRGAGGPEDQR